MRLVVLQSAVLLLLIFVRVSTSFSDVGKWDLSLSGKSCEFHLAKSLFKGSKIEIEIHCDVMNSTTIRVNYKWTPEICSPDYFHYFEKRIVNCTNEIESYIAQDSNIITQNYNCLGKSLIVITTDRDKEADSTTQNKSSETPNSLPFAVENDGVYQLWMTVESDKKYNASMKVSMYLPSSGYLSAAMWPLLPFFGVMCGYYTVLCTCWLIICGLQWRDLLRIQFWIGGVALLGMIETATYYGVYSSVNKTGYFNAEAYMFAEWISVAKRALARMLVIIVSLGFGIVKPRLGPALQRVVGAGLAWGALAAIEAWLRLHHKADDSNRDLLLSEAPLSLLDSAICWWVFVSLSYTMRTLQLRRNTIKLSLYKHFTNTLIFAVVSSVIFMLYSIRTYRVRDCITSWREVWIDEAYWHILFASVLTVIMILWRPTNNNQRYAFTPLLDNAEDDDDEEEQFVNDAYGVKMRGTSISGGGGGAGAGGDGHSDAAGPGAGSGGRERDQHDANSLDSDLRWVEENIPTSALPLLDSDEEIINTKFEVSKMQ